MERFVKVYDFEEGQLLVMTGVNEEDEPELVTKTKVNRMIIGVNPSFETYEERNEHFESMNEEKAKQLYEAIRKMGLGK